MVEHNVDFEDDTDESEQARVYFVSGHLDLTQREFEEHYVPQLREALAFPEEAAVDFVVGDAPGADRMTQLYLGVFGARATVFHMLDEPRNNPVGYATKGGFSGDLKRDHAMTEASTHDIGWVRPGRERSGTAKNLARRELGI